MFIDWLHRSDLSAHDFLEMKAFSTVFECIRYKRGIFHVVLDSINSFDVLQFWRKNLHLYLSPKKKYIHTHTHIRKTCLLYSINYGIHDRQSKTLKNSWVIGLVG